MEKQITEGLIGEYQKDFQKKLPIGITQNMVDLFLGKDGFWHWHLKNQFIKNEEERKQYEYDKKQWATD